MVAYLTITSSNDPSRVHICTCTYLYLYIPEIQIRHICKSLLFHLLPPGGITSLSQSSSASSSTCRVAFVSSPPSRLFRSSSFGGHARFTWQAANPRSSTGGRGGERTHAIRSFYPSLLHFCTFALFGANVQGARCKGQGGALCNATVVSASCACACLRLLGLAWTAPLLAGCWIAYSVSDERQMRGHSRESRCVRWASDLRLGTSCIDPFGCTGDGVSLPYHQHPSQLHFKWMLPGFREGEARRTGLVLCSVRHP